MENAIQLFNFDDSQVRIAMRDGEPWFSASDVASILGYLNAPQAVADHCKHREKITISNRYSIRGNPSKTFIPISDVYRLIVRSKLPSAERFEEWVMEEVLPSIHKHGVYMTPEKIEEALTDPDTIINLAQTLKAERAKLLAIEAKVEEDKPKVDFADAVSTSKDTILVGDLSKLLQKNGIDIGPIQLFDWLRFNGYLMKKGQSKNVPTQKSMKLGLFDPKVGHSPYGHLTITPCVTGKGQLYFIKLFRELYEF